MMDSIKVMDGKMAEMLTFRQEDSGNAPQPWAWGYRVRDNTKLESRPATLKEYYDMDYDDPNNPFSRFNARGSKSWSNGDMTLKLKDVFADADGAAALEVKPHWRVKIKITFGDANTNRFRYLTNSRGEQLEDAFVFYNDAVGQQYKNYISGLFAGRKLLGESTSYLERQSMGATIVTANEIWLVLDGDAGDEIHFDIDGEHDDIGQLYLSAGGRVFTTKEKLDSAYSSGQGDNWVKITLAGVFYKPSEYDDGKIEDHREHEIIHDINNGLIKAVDSEGNEIISQTYFLNTDPKAVRNYIVGEIDYAEQVALRKDRDKGDGCPANATYDSDNNYCVCDEGYVSDMFGEACVEKEETDSDNEPQGCPTNSKKREDGFCYCDDGYKYKDGACVVDDSNNSDSGLTGMELLDKYGLYAVLGIGAVVAVSMLRS